MKQAVVPVCPFSTHPIWELYSLLVQNILVFVMVVIWQGVSLLIIFCVFFLIVFGKFCCDPCVFAFFFCSMLGHEHDLGD